MSVTLMGSSGFGMAGATSHAKKSVATEVRLQAFAGLGREEGHLRGIDVERQVIAPGGLATARGADLDRSDGVAAPDDGVGAHGLDDVDLEARPYAVACNLEMLRPDAEHHFLARGRSR